MALLFGGYGAAMAGEPCNSSNECYPSECNTPACQAQEGFQTIGQGVENAASGSYNTVKEGTVNTYEKAANGVEKGYEYVKEGTVNTYEKAKNGVENVWNSAKEKIHNATE